MERKDYQVAKFKQAGINVNLSAHFGAIKAGPADQRDIPFIEEFGKFDGKKDRIAVPHSESFDSPEIQSLHIRQMVHLLTHKNPHTGLTYAADPVIAVVEIVNEQSILFLTSTGPLKASPTLRRQVGSRFCAWLKKKYGNLQLNWVGHIAARGESRRFMGDYILNQNDVATGRIFPDVVAISMKNWFCLHYIQPEYDFRGGAPRPAQQAKIRN